LFVFVINYQTDNNDSKINQKERGMVIMKKKVFSLLLTVAMVLSLAACGNGNNGTDTTASTKEETTTADSGSEETKEASGGTTGSGGYEIALVTDLGTIDDKSFNQGAWEGVEAYGDEFGVSYKYYQPTEKTTAAYVETIGLAVEGGASVVVCPGFLFEPAVYEVQDTYPEVNFILIDGEPHSEDYSEYRTNDNVMCIMFQEDEAGFLAGYAAVKEGYTKLGFMGGMAVPAVIRYGYGYLQGAEYAAAEMGIDSVEVQYHYTGAFSATPEAQAMAASWYESGSEVIFGCGGAVGNSVMAAAQDVDKAVIGVDVDQSGESETVITSAMKKLLSSVYEGLKGHFEGNFPGGKTTFFDVTTDSIGLPMETSRFKTFSQDDYDAIYEKLVSGEVKIVNDIELETSDPEFYSKLNLSIVKATMVE